ncbi:MAG: hypothetical protein JW818_22570 [Pirellulales bacterium]|nr:hypothetical protein [Pirellulales bacterium]
MTAIWHDITMDEDPNDPGWYDIERIYCFDWDAFSDANWERLRSIYATLPGYQGSDDGAFPRWFSDVDDPSNGYLWAGVEPPGLQVAGTLPHHLWNDWDERFRCAIAALPFRQIE